MTNMGKPALKLKFEEVSVEDRLGKLESTVEHIQSDVSDMKGDIRRLDAKIDAKFDEVNRKVDAKFDEVNRKVDALKDSIAGKFDAGNASTAAKFDAVNAKFDAVNAKFDAVNASIAAQTASIEKARSKLVVWAFTLYIALAGTLLTVMGHGFHWF
jgi:peptidoglycan hydrolase CwlO-like protein